VRCGCARRTRDLRRQLLRSLGGVFGADHVRARDASDGPTAPDILAPNVAVTCVLGRQTSARAALREAASRTRCPDEFVVAVCKDEGEPAHVAMRMEDFMALLDEWQTSRRRNAQSA
jgi:hypothetical protein